ncbi:MAG: hypothetical protein IIW97_02595 [Alistipes sp.]|nr:hypothetical protein [Alistipes sp.]
MRRFFTYFVATIAIIIAGIGCQKENTETPVNKPTIGILDPEFDAESMTAKVMIAPSTDATAWYYKTESAEQSAEYTKVEGAAAQEIEFAVIYGVEYTITAYSENKAGTSDIATKKFCQMPKGEVTVAIGEITLNAETMEAEATIYPSSNTTKWYWRAYEKDSITTEWIGGEGSGEQSIAFAYEWGKTFVVEAYAECGAVKSEEVSAECYFEPSVPTITVSKPIFDEAAMTVSYDVTPSEDTDHWYYGIYDDAEIANYTVVEGNESQRVSFDIEYDTDYQFIFRAENILNEGNEEIVEFSVIGPVAEITIENLTAYTLDAVIEKSKHCVRYVAGAVHTSAYDRALFIEQAQASLNPDPSYPFAVFNSATESRTFSEQDLVRNSRIDSNENAGIIFLPNTSYTIAVYGENAKGNYTVTTKEVVIPEVELNGTTAISVEVSEIGLTSAMATVTTEVGCKVLTGYIDPALAKSDAENPFDFEGKSEAEIKAYIAGAVKGVPTIYSKPFTYTLSNLFAIDTQYVAYAIAIKDGKVGEVAYTTFKTLRPSLSGEAKIVKAEIVPQTTHETLTVKLTTDNKATKVRLYAAPASDHAAYADNLEYIMDSDHYQNYREEYEIVDGVATCVVNIYHPTAKYYLYASAVDGNGRAGEMVCVAQLAGLNTDYCTTIEEIIEEAKIDLSGTGTVDLVINISGQVDDRISLTVNTDSRSANAKKVWLIRFNGFVAGIEDEVKYAFSEYAETKKVKGSYKEAKVGYPLKYEDSGSDWDPKYEALQEYNATYGGDILVAVVLDTNDKFCIYSYYTAGGAVKLYN